MAYGVMGFLIGMLLCADTGRSQSFFCDAEVYRPLCPGSVASCSCTTTGRTSFTKWNFPKSNLCLPDNHILLGQYRTVCAQKELHNCSSYINAFYVNNGTNCSTSTLKITAHPILNGIEIECRDLTTSEAGELIGTATLGIVGIPEKPMLEQIIAQTNGLIMRLINPSLTNFTAINITVEISNATYLIDYQQPININGLYENTRYEITILSTNCAGTSSTAIAVWTLASSPEIAVNYIYSITGDNDQIEIIWENTSENVTEFAIQIEQDGSEFKPINVHCEKTPCFYSHKATPSSPPYLVSVAAINGNNATGPSSKAFASTLNNFIHSTYVLRGDNASFTCSFFNESSMYCLVCCSSDRLVPPGSTLYNISIERGKVVEVLVEFGEITLGKVYYCKIAATVQNQTDCGGPVIGGAKTLVEISLHSGSANGNWNQTSIQGPFDSWKIIAISVGLVFALTTCGIVMLSLITAKRGWDKTNLKTIHMQATPVSRTSNINTLTAAKTGPVLLNFPNPGLLESCDKDTEQHLTESSSSQTVKYTNIHGTFEVTVV